MNILSQELKAIANLLASKYVSILIKHVDSPIKRKLEGRVQDFESRQSAELEE